MKFISCLNPQYVFNPYLKRYVVAACGKCEACLDAHAASWVQRLDIEASDHPFVWFVTFQYDETHVPQVVLLRKEDNPNYPLPSYIDSDTGEIFSLADCKDFEQKDVDFCYETKILNIVNVRDFQLFIKSIRKYAKKHYHASFRYFCTFEYGPQTYRPHLHSLFFIDSPLLSENFIELLNKYWNYGCVYQPHLVVGSASSYVASYVNSFYSLPKIYSHPRLRQRSVFSKKPPIGFNDFIRAQVKDIFLKQEFQVSLPLAKKDRFCDVPLWRSIRSFLYPYIPLFSSYTYLERVALYRLGLLLFEPNGEKYLLQILRQDYPKTFYSLFTPSRSASHRYTFNDNSFYHFCSSLKRVSLNCTDFGISLDYYVYLMSEFYDTSSSRQLSLYFHLQELYFQDHPLSDFIYFNPQLVQRINSVRVYDNLEPFEKYYVSLCMPSLVGSINMHLDYLQCREYATLYHLHKKINFENTKTKGLTDYLLERSSVFPSIINYKLKSIS